MIYSNKAFINQINKLAKAQTPFIFIVDYLCKKPLIYPLSSLNPDEILYYCNGLSNDISQHITDKVDLELIPPSIMEYRRAFDKVMQHIKKGNTFLTNLTLPTHITPSKSLKKIFHLSNAKYKLWFKDQFVVFSPETFVKIIDGQISAYPMKGTIDATIENAAEILLNNPKEQAEHATIVDLIRNDLSRVAKKVTVEKYRYLDLITTSKKPLYQASSKISGILPENYLNTLGEIIFEMLPAGSISGAPKVKTMEIISEAEQYERGYYTGVFGIFDGKNLDSAVMIRFIERINDSFVYKSGGGITCFSNFESEYNELIQKVYVPIGRDNKN